MTEGTTSRMGAVVLLDRILHKWLAMPAVVRWCAPVAIMGTLWWSSSQSPQPNEPSTLGGLVHNGMHVVAYASLAAAVWLALHATRVHRHVNASLAAVLLAALYGGVDEIHQSYVPGRVCSIADLLSDASGALLAVTWLRSRIDRVPISSLVHVGLALACVACVCLATFGPW